MSTKASVSVIIPCYNSSSTITRAVKSVFNQTVLPLEIILIDDASQDNTLEILYAIRAEHGEDWIKVIPFTENRGPSAARNAGWEQAKAEYIAFLDADDSWHPQKVEIQYGWMQKNPSIVLTGHPIRLTDVNYQIPSYSQQQIAAKQVSKRAFLCKNFFSTPTVMISRSLSLRFDEDQSFAEDYLLWLKTLFFYGDVYLINLPMAFIYKSAYGEAGLSSNLWLMEKGELQTYKKIFKAGNVTLVKYRMLTVWSILKYAKRITLRKLKWS
jgi:glycosyltransferase involved in cell wall biosynthesis